MSNLSEDPGERARKYIETAEANLRQDKLVDKGKMVEASSVTKVSDAIHRYVQDARFYLDSGKPATSLASIAYAEGLLDALVFLGLTERRTRD